jgi:hypothetical protein
MAEVSAHELQRTTYCSRYGCLNERRYDRTIAVGLCEEHGKPLLSAHAEKAHAAKRARRAAEDDPQHDTLREAGKRVSKAFDRLAKARYMQDEAERDAKRALAHAIRLVTDRRAA